MAGECIHGFAPGTCLICQTLDPPKGAKPTKAATRAAKIADPRPGGQLEPQSGPRVVPKAAPRTGSPAVLKVIGLAVAVVIVIVLAWAALHLVFAVLHIVELIGVGIIALYLGWVAGVHHGRKLAKAPRK